MLGRGLAESACRRLTLVATVLGSSMAYVTAINVALPMIGEDLGIDLGGQQWIVLSYSLSLASLYLIAGALGDRLGRRRMFILGTIGFAAASALGGIAPNAAVLIVARVLQGAAGALLTTGSLSLLRTTFGDASGRAIGIWTTGTGVVSLAGPPLGGALVEWASWRWIFFLNLPLAAGAVYFAWLGRGASSQHQEISSRLDITGAALAGVGIGFVTYGLVQAGEQGFADVAWAFALGVAALASFLLRERRAREPLLPLGLFRNRDFTLVNVETFLVYGALAGSMFFLGLFLQSVIGYTPFEAGLLLLPSTVVLLVLAPRFGRLADRYGPRPFLVAGPLLLAAGMLLWLLVDDRNLWDGLLPGLLLYGLGLSMIVAPITAAALTTIPESQAGIAAGVNATSSRLGSLAAQRSSGSSSPSSSPRAPTIPTSCRSRSAKTDKSSSPAQPTPSVRRSSLRPHLQSPVQERRSDSHGEQNPLRSSRRRACHRSDSTLRLPTAPQPFRSSRHRTAAVSAPRPDQLTGRRQGCSIATAAAPSSPKPPRRTHPVEPALHRAANHRNPIAGGWEVIGWWPDQWTGETRVKDAADTASDLTSGVYGSLTAGVLLVGWSKLGWPLTRTPQLLAARCGAG